MITVKITELGFDSTSHHNTKSIQVAIGRAVRKRYGAGHFFYPFHAKNPLKQYGTIGHPVEPGVVVMDTGSVIVEVD